MGCRGLTALTLALSGLSSIACEQSLPGHCLRDVPPGPGWASAAVPQELCQQRGQPGSSQSGGLTTAWAMRAGRGLCACRLCVSYFLLLPLFTVSVLKRPGWFFCLLLTVFCILSLTILAWVALGGKFRLTCQPLGETFLVLCKYSLFE